MNQQIKTGLGVAIIVIIAATAAFFTWKVQKIANNDNKMPTAQTSSNQKNENAQVANNTVANNSTQNVQQKQSEMNEKANWKTYENKTHKFSIQYPVNYFYKEDEGEQFDEEPVGFFLSITFGKNPEDWKNSITINVTNNNKIVADKLAAPNGMDPEFTKDVTIGGMPGKNYDDESFVVSDDNYRFEINDSSEGLLKNELKSMVNTFKFIK